MMARDDFDPLAPQREAAFFYGLFLRGHDVDTLRQDIDVPRAMLDKWLKAHDFEVSFRENLRRVYAYRKQVLAIFDGLISNEQMRPALHRYHTVVRRIQLNGLVDTAGQIEAVFGQEGEDGIDAFLQVALGID
jgi:hypothetical protein